MNNVFKRFISITISALMAVSLLAGCSDEGRVATPPPIEPSATSTDTYVFIGKDIQNPYMQKMYEGFEIACSENGVKTIHRASESASVGQQAKIISEVLEQDISGLVIAANDADALEKELKAAMEAGVKVISLDSAVNSQLRQTHIQQADPEKVGRELIRGAYELTGGNGGVAILSSTKEATNQNLWIRYMKKEMAENAEKYASMPIITIAYGDDDTMKSRTEAQALLENDAIDVIISPTTVGILATAELIKENDADVKLIGLGMPSEMAPYIEEGICQRMYLWDPVEIGYLAGYTMDSLVKGSITGAVGEMFDAGELGRKTITDDHFGGSEVVLGEMLRFDRTNIANWKNEY